MSTDGKQNEEAFRAILGTPSAPSLREKRASMPGTRPPPSQREKRVLAGKSMPALVDRKSRPAPSPSNPERRGATGGKRRSNRDKRGGPPSGKLVPSGRERRHGSQKEAHRPAILQGLPTMLPQMVPMPAPVPSNFVEPAAPPPVLEVQPDHTTEFGSMEQAALTFCDALGKKGLDGVMAEYLVLKAWKPTPFVTTMFDQNMSLNRYKDVPCIEWSRVRVRTMRPPPPPPPKLPPPPPATQDNDDADGVINVDADTPFNAIIGQADDRQEGGGDEVDNVAPFNLGDRVHTRYGDDDYVHANYVEDYFRGLPDANVKFICAQGPLEGTVGDFWRMAYHERSPMIVMLCQFMEMGKEKCATYYPTAVGETKYYDKVVRVTCMSAPLVYSEGIITRNLQIDEVSSGKSHRLIHFQWQSWPDKGVPQTSLACILLAKHLIKYRNVNAPSIIHCSAGIGRTGTLAALALCIQRITNKRHVDMPWMVKMIRQQRVHSVQTQAQYAFVYRAFINYLANESATRKMIATHRGAQKFIRDYDAGNVVGAVPNAAQPPAQDQPQQPPMRPPSQKPPSSMPAGARLRTPLPPSNKAPRPQTLAQQQMGKPQLQVQLQARQQQQMATSKPANDDADK